MGYKTNNFHATKHVPDDILMFGPPHVTNTKSDKMKHKADKKSAKITQKRPKTFDFQCAERVEDRRIYEFALLELAGKPRWDYYQGFERLDQLRVDHVLKKPGSFSPMTANITPFLTGVTATFSHDLEEQAHTFKVFSAMKRKSQYRYPEEIANAIADLAEDCRESVSYTHLTLPTILLV